MIKETVLICGKMSMKGYKYSYGRDTDVFIIFFSHHLTAVQIGCCIPLLLYSIYRGIYRTI